MCPRRGIAESTPRQDTRRSEPPRQGRAERSARRFFLATAVALALLSLLAFLVPQFVSVPPSAEGALSWRPTAIGAAVVLGLLLWELRGAGVLLAVGIGLIELPLLLTGTPGPAALATFSQTLLIGLLLGFAGTVLLRLSRSADAAAGARARAAAAAASAAGANAARARAAALVHDEVLQALNLAAAPHLVDRTDLARQAARARALLADAGDEDRQSSLTDALRHDVRALDPDAEFEVCGTPPEHPPALTHAAPQALRGAVRQALRNSLLHAGPHARRRVSIAHGPSSVRITVADDGVGFHPGRVPARRLGLRTATRAIRAVGGEVTVRSGAGSGTWVVLSWPAGPESRSPAQSGIPGTRAPSPPAADAGRRDVPRLGGIAPVHAGSILTAVVFALTQAMLAAAATATAQPWWAPLPTLLLLLAAALLLLRRADARPGRGHASLVLGLIGCALLWGLSSAPFEAGALWFAGAAAFLLAALSFRGRPLAAAVGALVLSALVVTGGMAKDAAPFTIVSMSVRPLGVTLFAVGLTLAILALLRRIAAESAEAEAESARASWERSARAELAARSGEVRLLVDDLLAEIAAGEVLSERTRGLAGAVEGQLRDRIRAGRLAIEPLMSAVMRARRRGVDVLLLDDRESELPAGLDLPRLAARLATACDEARAQLTVRVLPSGRASVVSLVVDGAPIALPENHQFRWSPPSRPHRGSA